MVEGVFSRGSRLTIRPIELGRRVVREMDDQRSVDVNGRRVVPNFFVVKLNQKDYDGFANIKDVLVTELVEAAREYARAENYHFLGPVVVQLDVDGGMKQGRFEVLAELRQQVVAPATPAASAAALPATAAALPSAAATVPPSAAPFAPVPPMPAAPEMPAAPAIGDAAATAGAAAAAADVVAAAAGEAAGALGVVASAATDHGDNPFAPGAGAASELLAPGVDATKGVLASEADAASELLGSAGGIDDPFAPSDEGRGAGAGDGASGALVQAISRLVLPNGQQHTLGDEVVSIGRVSENTIPVPDPNVSRRHAEVRPNRSRYVIVDLGSTNGTLVNGTRIHGETVLSDGDVISLGTTYVRFESN